MFKTHENGNTLFLTKRQLCIIRTTDRQTAVHSPYWVLRLLFVFKTNMIQQNKNKAKTDSLALTFEGFLHARVRPQGSDVVRQFRGELRLLRAFSNSLHTSAAEHSTPERTRAQSRAQHSTAEGRAEERKSAQQSAPQPSPAHGEQRRPSIQHTKGARGVQSTAETEHSRGRKEHARATVMYIHGKHRVGEAKNKNPHMYGTHQQIGPPRIHSSKEVHKQAQSRWDQKRNSTNTPVNSAAPNPPPSLLPVPARPLHFREAGMCGQNEKRRPHPPPPPVSKGYRTRMVHGPHTGSTDKTKSNEGVSKLWPSPSYPKECMRGQRDQMKSKREINS